MEEFFPSIESEKVKVVEDDDSNDLSDDFKQPFTQNSPSFEKEKSWSSKLTDWRNYLDLANRAPYFSTDNMRSLRELRGN